MQYAHPITISQWQLVQEHFNNIASGSLKNIVLSAKEKEWITEHVLPEINIATGATHTVSNAIIFVQPPKSKGVIHVDGFTPNREGHPNWALNIPLTTSDAEMYWYEGNYTLTTEKNRGMSYLDIHWNYGPNLAKTIKVDRPMIVNINTPHCVTNFSNHIRTILSIRFNPDLSREIGPHRQN